MNTSIINNFTTKTAATVYHVGAYAVKTAQRHPLATAVLLLGTAGFAAYTVRPDLFPFNAFLNTAETTNTQFANTLAGQTSPVLNPIPSEKVSDISSAEKLAEKVIEKTKTIISPPLNSRKSGSFLYRAAKKGAKIFCESIKTLAVMAPIHTICSSIAPKNNINAQNACLYISAAAARAVIDYESELPFLSDYIGDPIEPEFPVPLTEEEIYYQQHYQPPVY